MKQYTTPTESLFLPVDISTGCDVWVYLSHDDAVVEKTGNQLGLSVDDLGQTRIDFSLTQDETAKLSKGSIAVEVTWKNRASGFVGKSETGFINGVESLKKGEI